MDHHLHQQANRGAEAERLLAEPLLIEAFEVIERDIIEEIKKCPIRDVEGLRSLHLMLGLHQRLRRQIESVATTGKLARETLAQRAARAVRGLMPRRR